MATERSVVIFSQGTYGLPCTKGTYGLPCTNVMVAVELTLPLLYCSDYLSQTY